MLELFMQILGQLLPITMRTKMRKGHWKCWIVPPSGNPGGIMKIAERPQSFNQVQRAPVERSKCLIALQQDIPLAKTFCISTGGEQPNILHCRSRDHVVKVQKKGPL
jgi:hypothetical protein